MDGSLLNTERRAVNAQRELPSQMSIGQWLITFIIIFTFSISTEIISDFT